MPPVSKSDRLSELRRISGETPEHLIMERLFVPEDPIAIRAYAEQLDTIHAGPKVRLVAADAYSEAGTIEPDIDQALTDFAHAGELYGSIVQTDKLHHGMLHDTSVKAAMQLAYLPVRQAMRLTGSLPPATVRSHTLHQLQGLSTEIYQQWGLSFGGSAQLERVSQRELIGAVSEQLVLLLLLRYGQRFITDAAGNPDTSWMVLPTTTGQDAAGKAHGDQYLGWDISILTQLNEDFPPVIAEKIQVKSDQSYHTYDPSVTVVSLKRDLYQTYNQTAPFKRSMGSQRAFELIEAELVNPTHRLAGPALDFLTKCLLDVIENNSRDEEPA